MILTTSNNLPFIVDDDKAEEVSKFSWSGNYNSKTRSYSVMRLEKGNAIRLSRFLMNPPEGFVVDHINGDVFDNRVGNLRVCTREQNLLNKKVYRNSKTGVKGVHINNGYIRMEIRRKGKRITKQGFKTINEAAKEYNRLAIEMFGEFARLNPVE